MRTVLRGKLTALNVYVRTKERSRISLSLHFRQWEKECSVRLKQVEKINRKSKWKKRKN